MKKLFLNNEEIFVGEYRNSIDTKQEDYELFLSLGIKSFEDYSEACKLKNIKPGDVLKLSASNALLLLDTSVIIKETVSYHINLDNFLDEVATVYCKFKIEKDIKENAVDLTSI